MCQDMSEKDVTSLRKLKDKRGVKWFCDSCNIEIERALMGGGDDKLATVSSNSTMKGKLDSIEDMVMRLTTAVSTSQSKLEERMQKLETSHAQAVASNKEGVKTAAQLHSDAKAQFDQILEQQQSEHRKKNCIVSGIEPEAGKTPWRDYSFSWMRVSQPYPNHCPPKGFVQTLIIQETNLV